MAITYQCPKCKRYWRNVGYQMDDSVERDNRCYQVEFVEYHGSKAKQKTCYQCTPEPKPFGTKVNIGKLLSDLPDTSKNDITKDKWK